MDIVQELQKRHSKETTTAITNWIGRDKKRLSELMDLYQGSDTKLQQRAAWVMTHVAELHPDLLDSYQSLLVDCIDRPGHDAIRRNAARSITFLDLDEDLWGIAYDKCIQRLTDPAEKVGLKRFAMEIAWNICQQVPELAPELKMVLEDGMEYNTAGFKSFGGKVLKQIAKLKLAE